ncbi:MAG TPA: DUF4352 domain-containing protein [Pseudonocardia sp.]|jgi:hypothetical protein|uniref:DUF4352 domain-containing protein n=1 Tax=Pseudonocardia sp. TaxID=60912 RepID=UPI002C5D293C|nr:DUF4352 domain-containing protein [Pseudonocardia sp.]HTF50636.1 DUF4352 domain-containing protein [Pseudonocardia sp.]
MSQPQPQYTDPRDAKARAKAEKAYQKAQRPWFKKKRFIIPLALVLLFIIIGVSGGGGDTKPTVSGNSAAPGPASGPPAFPGATKDDVVAQAGQSVDAEALSVTTGPLKPGDATGGATLCAPVSYKNGKDEPVNFNGGFDWKLQDPNGAAIMTTLLGSDNLLSAGEIAPGGQTSGDVCFQAKSGLKGQYVLLYDPSFRFTSDRIAWLNQR